MKKLLLILPLILFTTLPTFAYNFSVNNIYYNILSSEDQTCEVTYRNSNYNSYSGDKVIPSTVTYSGKTYSVTAIGESAFEGCKSLTSITLPNSVTTIGKSAFEDCKSLTSITLPNSLATIGGWAFSHCKSLTSITIPNSVTTIGNGAFYDCSSLTSITLPNSVTTIGISAFYYCYSLTSITLPNSLTTIGDYAFSGCKSLTSITIPNSVTTIGKSAFSECKSLKSFIGKFASDDNRCLIVDGVLNSFAPAELTTYTIPNSVTTIGYFAFDDCTSLTSITIPNSVTTIGDLAFCGCSSLTSITIPNSVITIGDYTFSNCKSLTSITLPNSLTTIGERAFQECTSLTSVTLPNSLTTIGNNPFWGCSNLKSFTGKFASDDHRCLIVDGVLNSFAPAELTTYTIPNSVTTIGNGALGYCSSLTSITIPNSVTTIGNYAFNYCSNLTEIISLAVTPPSVYSDTFYRVPTSTCTLKVPAESVEAYKSAFYWKNFDNIIPLTEEELQALPVESITATPTLTTPTYNLRGQRVGTTHKGIVIRNRHKVILK